MILPLDADIFLARQPILDREQKLVAYELLFRSSGVDRAAVADGHLLRTATSLFKLHELLGESDATVFWIPTERPSEDVGD